VLIDHHPIGRKCAINQQGFNGVLSLTGVVHFMKKLRTLIAFPQPQSLRFLPPTHLLHEIFNSLTASSFLLFSSPKVLSSSMVSKALTSSERIFFYLPTSPNISLFHLLRSTFKTLSLLDTTKLGEPWK
jgi:hypothetical protein